MRKKTQKTLLYLFLLLVVMFNSCTTDTVDNYNLNSEIEKEQLSGANFTEINVDGTLVTVEELTDGNYALGDMLFSKSVYSSASINTQSRAVGRTDRRWPNNIVSYYVQEDVNGGVKNLIDKAIRHVELFTNIRFVETDGSDLYALTFYSGGNCSASLGYVDEAGHSNFIYTGECNSSNAIVHEICHVLGLWHEQSRADRNDYIQVHFENTTQDSQFLIYGGTSNGFEYTEFDFNSIMLYHSYAASSNGQPVMTKIDGSTFESNTSGQLSDLDIQGLEIMYPEVETKLYSIMGENGMYVSSELGRQPITCNRTGVGAWEKFIITPVAQGKIVIQENKKKKYLTYDEEENAFTFNAIAIEDAVSFLVNEYSYGQTELFYGDWYDTLKLEGYNKFLHIDESSDGIVRLDYSSEFRIERVN